MRASQSLLAARSRVPTLRRWCVPLPSLPATRTCVACRTHVRHSSRRASGGLSLSALASAFSELGKATATSSSSSAPAAAAEARSGGDKAMSRSTEAAPVRLRAGRTDPKANASPSPQQLRTAGWESARGGKGSGRAPASPLSGASHDTRPHPASASASSSLGLVTFSLSYSRLLAEMDAVRLTTEVEEQHRRQHFGNMMSCLLEVYFRLLDQATLDSTPANPPGDDRLLLATLSCLTKIDLSEVEAEVEAWMHTVSAVRSTRLFEAPPLPPPPPTTLPSSAESVSPLSSRPTLRTEAPPPPPFLATFCDLMQRWMLERVSEMDAALSVACLHLLAQQKLFFSDPLLATLADNVACRHAGSPSPSSSSSSSPFTDSASAPRAVLPLDVCAVLLDVLARYQVSVLTALRVLDRPVPALADTVQTEQEGVEDGTTVRRTGHARSSSARPLAHSVEDAMVTGGRQWGGATRPHKAGALAAILRVHPVLNETFFRACAEALVQSLDYATVQAQTSSIPSEQQQQQQREKERVVVLKWAGHNVVRFAQLPTASFFFLTRALAKLRFFDATVVPALLPHLVPYLLQHPEQYLGPILLLGRVENTSIDVEVVMVLLRNVNGVLRRRGEAYTSEMRSQAHAQQQRTASPSSAMLARAGGAGAGGRAPWSDALAGVQSPLVGSEGGEGSEVFSPDGDADGALDDELFAFQEERPHLSAIGATLGKTLGHPMPGDHDKSSRADAEAHRTELASSPSLSLRTLSENPALHYHAQHGKMLLSKQIARAQAQVAMASARADADYQKHPQRVSLIALHVSPTFLSSVLRAYELAWEKAMTSSADAPQGQSGWVLRRALFTEMWRLYVQLLDDLEQGLPRQLEVLTRSMPAAVVEVLLGKLLDGRELLQSHLHLLATHAPQAPTESAVDVSSSASSSSSSSQWTSNNNDSTGGMTAPSDAQWRQSLHTPHALLVTLTFLWTQQLRRWPLPRGPAKVSVEWCTSATQLTHALLAAGLLDRRDAKPSTHASPSHRRGDRSDRGGATHYRSGRSTAASSAEGAGLFHLHFIPEELLREAPRVEELVQRAKLTKLLGLHDAEEAKRGVSSRGAPDEAEDALSDPVVREVRNSSVFFPFSRRIEFAESGRS